MKYYRLLFVLLCLSLIACRKDDVEDYTLSGLEFIFDEINHTAAITYDASEPNPDNEYWPELPTPTYSGEIVVPEQVKRNNTIYTVTTINRGAFYNSSITEVSLPSTIVSIGEYSFGKCEKLKKVSMPNGIITIEEGTFYYCRDLVSVNIPESVKTIKAYAFWCCSSLLSLVLPDGLDLVEDDALHSVPNVIYHGNKISFDENRLFLCDPYTVNGYVLDGLVFKDSSKSILTACPTSTQGDVIIPLGTKEIGDWAFNFCHNITSVFIPDGVTGIGRGAFYCEHLKRIYIPDSVRATGQYPISCPELEQPVYNATLFVRLPVKYSGTYEVPDGISKICLNAFDSCHELECLILPKTTQTIMYGAYDYCDKLTSIVCYAINPPDNDHLNNRRINISEITLYVPKESIEAYSHATAWKDFLNIKAIP